MLEKEKNILGNVSEVKSQKTMHCGACGPSENSQHPDHTALSSRIHRIIGQLKGIESMMQQREYCMDIFQQTRAARNAIKALEAKILKTHLETCVSEAILSKDKNEIEIKIEEIVGLFSKF